MKTIEPHISARSENKERLGFVAKSTVAYSLCYFFVGAIAYQLITKQFYTGDHPIFNSYLRSESSPAEWTHATTWLVPGLLLRVVLISLVLLPFVETLKRMAYPKRVGVIFALLFVLIHIAAVAPSSSNIEGLIYMKAELVSVKAFLLTQPEMILQCFLFALSLSWILKKPDKF